MVSSVAWWFMVRHEECYSQPQPQSLLDNWVLAFTLRWIFILLCRVRLIRLENLKALIRSSALSVRQHQSQSQSISWCGSLSCQSSTRVGVRQSVSVNIWQLRGAKFYINQGLIILTDRSGFIPIRNSKQISEMYSDLFFLCHSLIVLPRYDQSGRGTNDG